MVFTATAIAEFLVIKNLDLQLFELHVAWVGNGELEGLFPYWSEVSVFCGGSFSLTVKVCNDIGAGASLTVFGEKITCIDYFY
jgi:hypothetical protein